MAHNLTEEEIAQAVEDTVNRLIADYLLVADGYSTIESVAKKYKVSIEDAEKQIALGSRLRAIEIDRENAKS